MVISNANRKLYWFKWGPFLVGSLTIISIISTFFFSMHQKQVYFAHSLIKIFLPTSILQIAHILKFSTRELKVLDTVTMEATISTTSIGKIRFFFQIPSFFASIFAEAWRHTYVTLQTWNIRFQILNKSVWNSHPKN